VVVAAGGFVFNQRMFREHAPAYRGGLPLGTAGDDGTGIRLGTELGAASGFLDHVTAWRFITPPSALLRGVLVDNTGRRLIDESRYGAAVGDVVIQCEGRRAWLLVDTPILAEARKQIGQQTLWFQRVPAMMLLAFDTVRAKTVAEVAAKARVDPAGLAATLKDYNAVADAGEADPLGKPAELVTPLHGPSYALIDCSIRARMGQPAPMLTLGGLLVDEQTGGVRRPDGTVLAGLYAAGRTAVGICSNSYVSGLSLADCVFSGRRAGRHAALGG
jgi:3-oxo-5alpha-steroid 4-dehydrogenase